MLSRLALATALLWAGAVSAQTSTLVATPAEYQQALSGVRPGDTIVFKDGVWRDFQILFEGEGRAGQPITLTAETPGGVVLSGQSNLRLAGRHLLVSNLVFRDGWSPTGEVVSFRRSKEHRAVDSRVTGLVIDGYNKPDRATSDNWVALYGHDNRFDHNHLTGKTNVGTTLVVVRDEQQGLDNRHRIDHNYFGPRPNLGSNGGETMRVGTSADSLSASHTVVENNWFEGADGEVEIVSNKSGGNTYRGNVFYRSRGSMVLRHGDGNLVENNVFLGGGKPHTGGIRVINRNQTVRNNYMEGITGDGFTAALSVMHGVPDSPINRYHQVVGAVIENNTIINARSLFLGAGMDAERSAPPINSRFSHNLIVNPDGREPMRRLGDLSGVAFTDNVQSRDVALVRGASGLLVPETPQGAGASPDLVMIPRAETGVAWYPKDVQAVRLDQGAEIAVDPTEGALAAAVAAARPGDVLVLAPGRYAVDRTLTVGAPLTVRGSGQGQVEIAFSRPSLFEVAKGGSLKLAGLTVSGADAPDETGNAVIRVAPGSSAANFDLVLEDVEVRDLTVNRGFNLIALGKGGMADRVLLRDVRVENITGSVISAAAETDDRGTYNAELVQIEGGAFRRIGGSLVDLYRGGTDESTFGPRLVIRGASLDRVGSADQPSILMRGVQHAELVDNILTDSGAVAFSHRVGEPVLAVAGNRLIRTPEMQTDIAPIAATEEF
ncbi:polysaccharide lyase 6 family protein [Brevundimonas bullata]|uniref:polysaccharide lyase 6 family protein n=1 Tax=Brevundimonas bullata TaxID=13160 RepID=UPI000E09E6A4|nr:polysaccharide lyase 6 family protein [Brevundimonas bullata]WQE36927.1 polysaccharide lyase 6 family protein [Brevundimonas bullata]